MSVPLKVLLAAGGTGGHLFPAEALANALIARGAEVDLVSDDRATVYADKFPAKLHQVTSGTVTGSGFFGKLKGVYALYRGTRESRKLLARLKPDVVVGFGGYPTVPPLYAAATSGIPSLIHEQNAVMGRANRFLAPKVRAIATGFPLKDTTFAAKSSVVGNPVRPPVLAAAEVAFPGFEHGLRLLVTGGSQGARIMSDIVPPAVAMLTAEERARLTVTQQARAEDVERVRAAYGAAGVQATVEPFFKDLPARIAASHLVIGRSGASTVSELAVIGRAAILVPLPGSLDQDQAANARVLENAEAAILQPQPEFTPEWLSGQLAAALANPAGLAQKAANARSAAVPDAAERLADLVFRTAGR